MKDSLTAVLYHRTPAGVLQLCADDAGICGVYFGHRFQEGDLPGENDLLRHAARELDEYFAGTRREFDLPVSLHGTAFQLRVWAALQQIPYGETRSYAQVAAMAGNPKACRAVGMANHRNPVSILVPCHRVIHADGGLGGYGGGLEIKKLLLELEKGSR